jgi:hypothetical protein
MSRLFILIAAFFAPAFILPSNVLAQSSEPGKLRGAITVGTNNYGDGKLQGSAIQTFSELDSFDPNFPDTADVVTLAEQTFADVYDPPIEYGLELSYGLTESTEMYGSISYSETNRAQTQIGSTVNKILDTNFPIFAEFGPLKEIRADVGARYFFSSGALRPFVGGSIGIMRSDAMKASYFVTYEGGGEIAITDVPFFKQTTSVTAALEAGISVDIGDRLAARVSVGARYIPAFRDEDRVLDELSLGQINNGSSRVVYPVKASLSSSF